MPGIVRQTLVFAFGTVALTVAVSLALALILNQLRRLRQPHHWQRYAGGPNAGRRSPGRERHGGCRAEPEPLAPVRSRDRTDPSGV